jgi:glycosyltransferase involved in cell wall biosynthesis
MKIFFDNQIKLLQKSGGISIYFRSLAKALEEHGGVEVGLFQNPSWLRKSGSGTLVHHTFYIPFFPRGLNRYPRIVTVFDFIPESGSGFRSRRAHLSKNEYVKRADGVLFISETVRKEAERLGISPMNYEVTPLASRFTTTENMDFRLRKHQVLYVGNRSGYKNFGLLPAALALVPGDLNLVIVGGGPLSKEEKRLLQTNGVQHTHLNNVEDDELKSLYLSSKACLVPSKVEGFGLPLVEAMSMGCPVICLKTPIALEVGGMATISLDSESPEMWAEALARTTNDRDFWTLHSTASRVQAARFSWARTAELTYKLYKRVLDGF